MDPDHGWRGASSAVRVGSMAALGVLAALAMGLTGHWRLAPLIGWDAAALLFSSWVWLSVGPMNPTQTAQHSTRENPSSRVSDLVVVLAALASLAAVAEVLAAASGSSNTTKALLAGLGLASVAVSWITVQTLFTLRYALLYYRDPVGGIDFGQDRPRYSDFAYLAFTLGMTFQVSDTNITTPRMRVVVLRHCLLSYVFASVIVATTVNVIVSLTSGP
jgi:uncharacterized membrane protein